ncbi:hypothetical protein DPMN_043329 [Dreissena polymorpha]|uniref:Uncharacterized protein n=1 Tax=Dreissena polymorpha TaxID=45954 RepID=A0A9D4D088_DREPO|nr:hypothetical protein DPMN_043329 [Dreissena polymorpha]
MTYVTNVRDLAQKHPGQALYVYNQQFRMAREKGFHPWDSLYLDYWLLVSTQAPTTSPFPSAQSGGNNFRSPDSLFTPPTTHPTNPTSPTNFTCPLAGPSTCGPNARTLPFFTNTYVATAKVITLQPDVLSVVKNRSEQQTDLSHPRLTPHTSLSVSADLTTPVNIRTSSLTYLGMQRQNS